MDEYIRTARLIIRPFTERHINNRYVGWLNDQELMHFSEQRHRKHNLESCAKYLQSFTDSPNFFWAIEGREEGLGHIGNINAYIDSYNNIADLGLVIGEKNAQSKGFGLEAWLGVCHFLFSSGIRKITAGTMAGNRPMLKIMENAEMLKDGRRKRHYLCNGEEMDIVFKALFLNDWLAVHKS